MVTAIERVVAPFDQTYPPTAVWEETRVIPVPGQRLSEPLGVIVGADGAVVTVTVFDAEVALQPPEVTVTERVQDVVTVIDWVVAPLDQRFPVELLELRTTLPPGQNESGPLALIVGVGIDVVTVTTIIGEVEVTPFFVTLHL